MIEERELNTWSDFHDAIRDIRGRYGRYVRATESTRSRPRILFRGQADSEWELEPTLIRDYRAPYGFSDYYVRVNRTSDEVSSITGRTWAVEDFPKLLDRIPTWHPSGPTNLPTYEYLVYLRHRGFPSPLLDWTTSPYVAAFFAFRGHPKAAHVAVYCYVDTETGVRARSNNEPFIHISGPFATTDPRHFAQRSWYTSAMQWGKRHELQFCAHEEVLGLDRAGQDIAIRLVLPASERIAALEDLHDYNVNAFTLFQTEDALVETLAVREFDLDLP